MICYRFFCDVVIKAWEPVAAAPFLTFPRKRGKGLVGQDKLSYAPIPHLARVSPFPRLRGKVRKGAAATGSQLNKLPLYNFTDKKAPPERGGAALGKNN